MLRPADGAREHLRVRGTVSDGVVENGGQRPGELREVRVDLWRRRFDHVEAESLADVGTGASGHVREDLSRLVDVRLGQPSIRLQTREIEKVGDGHFQAAQISGDAVESFVHLAGSRTTSSEAKSVTAAIAEASGVFSSCETAEMIAERTLPASSAACMRAAPRARAAREEDRQQVRDGDNDRRLVRRQAAGIGKNLQHALDVFRETSGTNVPQQRSSTCTSRAGQPVPSRSAP